MRPSPRFKFKFKFLLVRTLHLPLPRLHRSVPSLFFRRAKTSPSRSPAWRLGPSAAAAAVPVILVLDPALTLPVEDEDAGAGAARGFLAAARTGLGRAVREAGTPPAMLGAGAVSDLGRPAFLSLCPCPCLCPCPFPWGLSRAGLVCLLGLFSPSSSSKILLDAGAVQAHEAAEATEAGAGAAAEADAALAEEREALVDPTRSTALSAHRVARCPSVSSCLLCCCCCRRAEREDISSSSSSSSF